MQIYWVKPLLLLLVFVNSLSGSIGSGLFFKSNKTQSPRVCVIGAGIAGLTTARYLQDESIPFKVLEATDFVGGTWRYDPRIGTDEYGQPIHTSMYKHLRTNLPKQTMQLTGFPVPDDMPSFPSWKIYYEYLKEYANHFELEKLIMFHHSVTSVKRVDKMWKVTYKNLATNQEITEDFDFVLICSGHHSKPSMPQIPGQDKFKGSQIHSHDYRLPDPYANRKVLIIGAGPSAMDISLDVARISTTLVHSHHSVVKFRTRFPPNFIKKPDVKEFNETGAIFVDGTYEELDDVLYCTGFDYHYPFLDESSGLTLANNYVTPLYKYMVNVHHPSMIFLGLVVRACLVAAIDAQSRYATALIKGNFTLPSKDAMLNELQSQVDSLRAKGRPMKHIHLLAEKEDQYYEELSKQSGTLRTPPVLFKIRTVDTGAKLEDLYTYRNYVYSVLDNETFVRRYEEPKSREGCEP